MGGKGRPGEIRLSGPEEPDRHRQCGEVDPGAQNTRFRHQQDILQGSGSLRRPAERRHDRGLPARIEWNEGPPDQTGTLFLRGDHRSVRPLPPRPPQLRHGRGIRGAQARQEACGLPPPRPETCP